MWRVLRLEQINALKPANPLYFKSLTLRAAGKQIGQFKTAFRPEPQGETANHKPRTVRLGT
jgi:hypothetical protein